MTTTRKADGDTVTALKRLLQEAGAAAPEGVDGANDSARSSSSSADAGAGANSGPGGSQVPPVTADVNRSNEASIDTIASLKRLLKNAGDAADGGDSNSVSTSSGGADAGAGVHAAETTMKSDRSTTSTPGKKSNAGSRTEGGDTIADLRRLISEAEEEKKKRDILVSNQKKEIEDMKERLEQVRLAKKGIGK